MDLRTKKIIRELCTDLQSELDDRYANRNEYPSLQKKYDTEMKIIHKAKDLVQENIATNRYFVFYYSATNPVGAGQIFTFTLNSTFPSFTEVGQLALHEITNH